LAEAAGEPLRAGDIIMAGGATAAEALAPGQHVKLSVEALGSVEFKVGAEA
jgi:2-oxo-3-hexenedioate decarboxylase